MSLSGVLCSLLHIGCPAAPVTVSPIVSPAPVVSNASVSNIEAIASGSSCISYKWKDRGVAPKGYIKGLAVMYAKEICRKGDSIASAMTKALGNSSVDALALYGLAPTMNNLFTLGTGLGMRESGGCYTCGYDTSAGSETATEAEAGLFQMSANAVAASSLVQPLLNSYAASAVNCHPDIFQEGSSCAAQKIIGSGSGAAYQSLVKSCPAAAVESAFIILRVLRKHWGPINRQEAEMVKSCSDMYASVESFVNANPSVCGGF